jgi:hypothetical protein
MNVGSPTPAAGAKSDDTAQSLARVLRLDDGWCGRCGADVSYKPLVDVGLPSASSTVPPVVCAGV